LNIGKARRAEEINALIKEQRQQFLTVCQTSLRLAPLFATLAGTGMRLGEVLTLHPGDLDLKGSCLRINRAFDEDGRLSTPEKRIRKNRRPVTSFGEHVDSTFTDASQGTTPIWLSRLSVALYHEHRTVP
jgi:integrase